MMPERLLKRSLKLEALWAGITGTRRLEAMPCSAVTVDGRTFATPLDASMHLLWLIQRLSYCEPHRDGMPADGPRLREAIRESRKLIAHLGYEPGKPLPNAKSDAPI